MTYTIDQLPAQERPRERLYAYGPDRLSTVELIAIILGSGIPGKPVIALAGEIMARFGDHLADASVEEFLEIKGLGRAKAIQLRAAFALGGRLAPIKGHRSCIGYPEAAYLFLSREFQSKEQECFVVLLLDVKGHPLRAEMVAVGSLSEVTVEPREVFAPAIRHKAASIILAHNHPSGDPTPSKEDLSLTKRLIAAGKTVGIEVVDHLILGRTSYLSLRQEGSLFS